jgi:predicted exporter
VAAPDWLTTGALPQWVIQAVALACIVFLVVTQSRGNLGIVFPVLCSLLGIAAFSRYAGRPGAPRNEDEDQAK